MAHFFVWDIHILRFHFRPFCNVSTKQRTHPTASICRFGKTFIKGAKCWEAVFQEQQLWWVWSMLANPRDIYGKRKERIYRLEGWKDKCKVIISKCVTPRVDKYRVLASLQAGQKIYRVPVPAWIQPLREITIPKRLDLCAIFSFEGQ